MESAKQNNRAATVAILRELAKKGLTIDQISQEMGYNRRYLLNLSRQESIPVKELRRRYSNDVLFYVEGWAGILPVKQIANRIGIPDRKVYDLCRRRKIETRCTLDSWSAYRLGKFLEVDPETIVRYIKRGLLPAKKIGSAYAIRLQKFLDFYYGQGNKFIAMRRIDVEKIKKIAFLIDYENKEPIKYELNDLAEVVQHLQADGLPVRSIAQELNCSYSRIYKVSRHG